MSYSFDYGATPPTLTPKDLGYIYTGGFYDPFLPNSSSIPSLDSFVTIQETGIYTITMYGQLYGSNLYTIGDSSIYSISIANNPGTTLGFNNTYYGYQFYNNPGGYLCLGLNYSRTITMSLTKNVSLKCQISSYMTNKVNSNNYPDATTFVSLSFSAVRIA